MPEKSRKILGRVSRVPRFGDRRQRGRCRLVEGPEAPSRHRATYAPGRRRGARAGVVGGRRSVQPRRRNGDDVREMLVGEKLAETSLLDISACQCRQLQAKVVPRHCDR